MKEKLREMVSLPWGAAAHWVAAVGLPAICRVCWVVVTSLHLFYHRPDRAPGLWPSCSEAMVHGTWRRPAESTLKGPHGFPVPLPGADALHLGPWAPPSVLLVSASFPIL